MAEKSANEELRVTIGVSKRAKEIWVDCAKTLGISQWDMTEVMFRLADPNNPKVKELALQIKLRNAKIKSQKKELTAKLKSLSSAQLEKLLEQGFE